MRLHSGFLTHTVNGEQIMVSVGDMPFAGLVRSNETAAAIVNLLKEETSFEAIVDALYARYDTSRDEIEEDVSCILKQLRDIGALDE